jgi:hypothetical protein
MELLFEREQTPGTVGRVKFKLFAKVELDDDERAIIGRYRFDQAMLIEAFQPGLIRTAALIGIAVSLVAGTFISPITGFAWSLPFALAAGIGAGWWYVNEKRETIFVRDLIHGRHFACGSVVDLAQKEAWLSGLVYFLRQVMQSAKHWDGAESIPIEALPKDEARLLIMRS